MIVYCEVVMSLSNWRLGTTKNITGTVTLNSILQDISADTITLRLKTNRSDADSATVLTKEADCASQGASGIYTIAITPGDTKDLSFGLYFYDIEWAFSGGERILEDGKVRLLDRVSDVPLS